MGFYCRITGQKHLSFHNYMLPFNLKLNQMSLPRTFKSSPDSNGRTNETVEFVNHFHSYKFSYTF